MEDKKIVSMLQEFVKDNYDKNEYDAVPKNWEDAYSTGVEDGWNEALSHVADFVGVDLENESKGE